MPQPLAVDPTSIQASAGELEMASSAAHDQLVRNASALAEAQSGWAGTSFGAFEKLRETWANADADRTKRLDDIAVSLRRSAVLYQSMDEAGADAIDSTV